MSSVTEPVSLSQKIKIMLEMIRFSHTIFALPFAILAAILAWNLSGTWSIMQFVGILWCMVTARSAAMAFNRIADWKIDKENPRTAQRHIPAGELTVSSVVIFAVFNSIAFIVGTLFFFPNKLPLLLSVTPPALQATLYS